MGQLMPNVDREADILVDTLKKITQDYLDKWCPPVVQKASSLNANDDEEEIIELPPKHLKQKQPPPTYEGLIQIVLKDLKLILDDPTRTSEKKITDFYKYLSDDPDYLPSGKRNTWTNNAEILQEDKHRSKLRMMAGVAIIALTIATLILPGLIIMGIYYACTHRHVFDLFKTDSALYLKELDLAKTGHPSLFKTNTPINLTENNDDNDKTEENYHPRPI